MVEQEVSYGFQPNNTKPDRIISFGLSSEVFARKLALANNAYNNIVNLGPFYGKDIKGQNPSFRVSSEPLMLPQHIRDIYYQLGQDIYALAQTLPALPSQYTQLIGGDWSAQIPFLWRLDTILDEEGNIRVNEIQISDGADGRMIGLQMAYGLCTLDQSTAGYVVDYLARKYHYKNSPPQIAFIRHDLFNSPYGSNAKRMYEFLTTVSGERVDFALIDKAQLDTTDWDMFDGVINYAFIYPKDLLARGINEDRILCVGDACYIGSKAIFAFMHDRKLDEFWKSHLGPAVFQRLKKYLINSVTVESENDITYAKRNGLVVKVYNTERLSRLGANRGVFGPWDLTDEAWQQAYSFFHSGSKLLMQDFVKPKTFPIFLRSNKGKDLEKVEWYNKVAVKYVIISPIGGDVALTGLEATLGKGEKPAGKENCITAVDFY